MVSRQGRRIPRRRFRRCRQPHIDVTRLALPQQRNLHRFSRGLGADEVLQRSGVEGIVAIYRIDDIADANSGTVGGRTLRHSVRSEEHTSELQSLMRISYAVFCLKKKNKNIIER